MTVESDIAINIGELQQFCLAVLARVGFAREDASIITDSLIQADLRGLNTHGVMRLPIYLQRLQAGSINPAPRFTVVRESPCHVLIDGDNGMGQVCGTYGMQQALQKAAASGIGIAGVRNSNHFGMAAYYVLQALKENMIGVALSNTEPLMPAPGGAEAVVGNNPIAVGIPAQNSDPIVLDMACSAAAIGKIIIAQKKGERIPAGWATDREGNITSDPQEALAGGFLLPVGGPKGYGLALVVDVLCGVLTGGGFGRQVMTLFSDFHLKQNVGHLFVALNPALFLPLESFLARVDLLSAQIKNSAKARGVAEIFLPGEIEWSKYKESLRGQVIHLPAPVVAELNSLARGLGMTCQLGIN
ncbi:MAG: hypothetical protein PWQ18_166 [Clostridia bacterium]|nr:hypothetical protein [Clostridia bacterium]